MASTTTTTTTTASAADSDDWDFVFDDGFVYKKRKRLPDPTSLARPPDPAPDPVSEERDRLARRRKALIQLKEKYEREISHWERLSNTVEEIEENAARSTRDQLDDQVIFREDTGNEGSRSVGSTRKRSKSWVDGLILQVEEQEQFLHTFSHLCDVAESLCYVQEDKTKRAYLDLDLWTCSPRELMASLTDDD